MCVIEKSPFGCAGRYDYLNDWHLRVLVAGFGDGFKQHFIDERYIKEVVFLILKDFFGGRSPVINHARQLC